MQLVRTAAPSGVGLLQLEEALLLQVGSFPLQGCSPQPTPQLSLHESYSG